MRTLAYFFTLASALVSTVSTTSSLLHAQTVTSSTTSVNFGSFNVCPTGGITSSCSRSRPITFNLSAGTTISGISIVTQGAPDLDYKAQANDTSTTLCTSRTYSSATSCTVDVTFAPTAAGTRSGAVEIIDGNGKLLATTYLRGIGLGAQIAFNPVAQVLRPTRFTPNLVAVDGSGNLFVTVDSNGTFGNLEEVVAAGGYTTTKTLNTTFDTEALAVDGAGNLFVFDDTQDQSTDEIKEIFAVGDYTTMRTVAKGINVGGLAVDDEGNLLVTDAENSRVNKILAAGGYKTVETLGSGFNTPEGIAVDGNGNVFVADFFNDGVKEIVAEGGYKTVKTLGGSFTGPNSVSLDAAGDVFVTSDGILLQEILAAGGYTTVETLASTYPIPNAVTVDGSGNVFTAVFPAAGVMELQRSQPPSAAFAATSVNSTSSDSPQTITVQNAGNAELTATELLLTDSTDFAQVAGSGAAPDCTSNFSLSAGEECTLNLAFAPRSAGPLTGSLQLTDNSGNAIAAQQSIGLSGTGLAPGSPVAHVSTHSMNFGSVAYPGSTTLSLTITNTGGGSLTIDPSINGLSFQITGNTCSAGVTTGSCVLQVEFAPRGLSLHTDHLTLRTNGKLNPSIALSGTGTGVAAVTGDVSVLLKSIDFGTIAFPSASNVIQLTIFDSGVTGPVTIDTAIDGPSYKIVSNQCYSPGVTSGNSFCNISVSFVPVSDGPHHDTLTLKPSIGPRSTIRLTGTATGVVP